MPATTNQQQVTASPLSVGDRVLLRDRLWRVGTLQHAGDCAVAGLEALDVESPGTLTVAIPPEEFASLPADELRFDLSGLEAFESWARAHEAIQAAAIPSPDRLSGARFGRVALEAYQLAPTLRVLAKPRPSLLIADDVGLGKTIEAGLVMLELLARRRVRRILIVTPPGLLLQWHQEILDKFGLEFTVIDGAAGFARAQEDLPAGANPWDSLPRVLTSVDYLKKREIRERALRMRWDLVVVDEAHALAESGSSANPYTTHRTRLGRALRDRTGGLILLTATPHNGYAHSFRSLVDLVEPTLATFRGRSEDVARRVQHAMIRRMKVQIRRRVDGGREERVFPPRRVVGIPVSAGPYGEILRKVASYCSKTARQAEGTEDAYLVSFAMQIVKKRALSSREAFQETVKARIEALGKGEPEERPAAAEVRDYEASFPKDDAAAERTARRILQGAVSREEKARRAEKSALQGIQRLLKKYAGPDPKVEALIAEIRAVAVEADERVIVFTEYLDTLEAIRERIERDGDLVGKAVVLKGGMTGNQRLRVQARFEEPEIRILLATDAASEGLNLQRCCRRVIHVELPWNPNRLEQRNGRVDRYGQTRPPEIRYLYYPDSPEDDVQHILVAKIEAMHEDQVSTSDILGILDGAEDLQAGLVALDPAAADVEQQKSRLVRLFEDRTADFVRNVRPLVSADAGGGDDARLLDLIETAEILLPDDARLEALVRESLGSRSFQPAGIDGVSRLEVPLRFRGPGVREIYPRATFLRSVAVRYPPGEVEFITPAHPLVRALAADARRRLVQVYPDDRGLPPRRLAARRVAAGEPASAVFTFLLEVTSGGGPVEERVLAIRVSPSGEIIGTPEEAARYIERDADTRDVPQAALADLFERGFVAMAACAGEEARAAHMGRIEALREERAHRAATFRRELDVDLADRLREIDDEEARAQGRLGEAGERFLFATQDEGSRQFEARRQAAREQAESRRQEIAAFERIDDPRGPRSLGVLFLVPGGEGA